MDTPENNSKSLSQQSVEQIKALQQELDILRYIYALFDAKWLVLLSGLLFGLAMMAHVRTLPEIYEAVTRVDIINSGDPGGVDPDNRRTPEAIGLMEHGFVLNTTKDNYSQTMLARLRSYKFTRHFMDKYNIYSFMYTNFWDMETQQWKDDFVLDKGLAHKEFIENYRGIWENAENEIISIAIRHRDPLLAAELANLYVSEFNEYIRQRTLTEVKKKQAFLHNALQQTDVVQIEKMIFRLLEAQTAAAMLANGREEYALEILDPAVRPYARHSPARKKLTVLAAFAGIFLSSALVIAISIAAEVKSKLDSYNKKRGRKPSSQRALSVRGIIYRLFQKDH